MSKLLSIIVPVYNEESLIAKSLPPILELALNKEVIVIDDGSDDTTPVILKELRARNNFTLIRQEKNQGKGAAVKKGLTASRGDYFIICDADLEYNPQDIPLLLTTATTAPENTAIYGSRFQSGAKISIHYLANRFLTALTNLLFGGQLTDMETCFKLIPSAALTKLNLRGQGFEIEPEISAQLLKAGYNILEIPISYRRRSYREGKKITARDGVLAVKTLIKERLRP